MLKHPALTLGRVEQFIRHELAPSVELAHAPLAAEFCPEPHPDAKSAAQGPWTPVEPGFSFGPAYRMVWFRVGGVVPADWDPEQVRLRAEVADERTLWHRNSPWLGIDSQHQLGRLPDTIRPGEKATWLIQALTRNTEASCHRNEPPRRPATETVGRLELVLIDQARLDLLYDCEFTLDLLKAVDERDPAYAVLLTSLNWVAGNFDADSPDTTAACRKQIRYALGSLNSELRHAVTPVGHAHLDTAWLWPLAITKLKMAHTSATQLHLMERYPEYVFAHSQASQYEWVEKEYPDLFKRIKAAIARGQWEPVGSMWVEADCNLAGGESLVRQFLYGLRYFREKLGVQTRDMWLPDVFGYAAALPQILAQFDIEYFLTQKISWNQFNRFPHNTFWWEGIDGTRVWTHFPPADTYIGDGTPRQLVKSVHSHRDHARSDQSLYLFGYGDGGGGPTERHLEYLRRARQAPCLPVVESGRRALDFFAEAKSKSRDLQTWVGELYLEYHRGTYTSQAANKRDNRACEFLLRDAEWLSCFAPTFPSKYPARDLEAAWKLVLLNQFHDILPGSSVREVYEDSARDYADVERIGGGVVHEALGQIAAKLGRRGEGTAYALFRNATASCQAALPWEGEAPASMAAGDERLPVQIVESPDGRQLMFATPAAALGAVAIAEPSDQAPTARPRLKARDRRLENDHWVVRFDGHGNIVSLASLEDRGVEFIAPGKLANLFQIFDDKPLYWSAWDIDAFSLEKGEALLRSESFEVVERGPVRVAVEVVKRYGNSTIRQRISLGPTPGVRFDTWVDWHETDKLLKVAFPINVNASRATHEIQFGHVERPTHANTSWDMAKFETCAHKWIDLSEGSGGVAVLNDSKYGHDVRGNVMRLSLLRSPKAPDPLCDMGEHRFTYVLLPHFGSFADADVVAAAYALNAPLRWREVEPSVGETRETPCLVCVDERDLVIEAVKKAETGNAIVVRLYEAHNCRGSALLSCARPVRRAWLCNLAEDKRAELEVVEGAVRLEYRPFEIITVMLEV